MSEHRGNETLERALLDTVADLEHELRLRGAKKARGLNEAVDELPHDRQVQQYRWDLKACARLRNAIVHNPYRDGKPIATPHRDIVNLAKSILGALRTPKRALDFANPPVNAAPDDMLLPHLRHMEVASLSQLPVLQDNKYVGLFTTNAVARWVAANMDETGSLLMTEVRISHVLRHAEEFEHVQHVAKDQTALDAVIELTRPDPPTALLITHSGRNGEHILGILTQADVPKLHDSTMLDRHVMHAAR